MCFFVPLCVSWFHFSLAIILLCKRELATLLILCRDCLCSVPSANDVIGWSAVCDCVISLFSHQLFALLISKTEELLCLLNVKMHISW